MNGETCVLSASTFHLRHESQQELNAKFIVIMSVTADSSPLSPTGGVNTIPPDTEIHEQMTMTNGGGCKENTAIHEQMATQNYFTSTTSLRPLSTPARCL